MTYTQEVLADAPLHYWPCASAPSPLIQDVGSAPRVLIINSVYPGGAYSGIESGGWAYYITANFQMESVVNPPAVTSPYSIELWFWIPYLDGIQHQFLAWDGQTNPNLDIYVDTSNRINGVSPGAALLQAAPTTERQWHQVVVAYDNGGTNLFVDGALIQSGAGSLLGFNKPLQIGARAGANGSTGLFTAISAYGSKLSAARVLAHFNAADLKAFQPVFLASGSSTFTNPAAASPAGQLDLLITDVTKNLGNAP